MNTPEPSFTMNVDAANPGQFFACCGLLELAHRLGLGAEGWFDIDGFHVLLPNGISESLERLMEMLHGTPLASDDPDADEKTAPLRLRGGIDLRLDWWLDETGGSALKTWAGQQSVLRIAAAMKEAMPREIASGSVLDHGQAVSEPGEPNKPVEPFYFDARRFVHPLDTGFSLDAQDAETLAHPAVEFLSLIGLQRFRPAPSSAKWCFEYWTWSQPLSAPVAAGVACGAVPISDRQGYCFRLRFRDDQKRYKAFSYATQIGGDA